MIDSQKMAEVPVEIIKLAFVVLMIFWLCLKIMITPDIPMMTPNNSVLILTYGQLKNIKLNFYRLNSSISLTIQ